MNTCTLTITSDEADDRIDLTVDYGSDVAEITHESANQVQKIMSVIGTFANQFLSGNIPNELVSVIMTLGTNVNTGEEDTGEDSVDTDDGVANEN